MAVLVEFNVLEILQFIRIELFDEPFRKDGHPGISAHRTTLDDGAFEDVADGREGDDLLRKLLANERHGSPRGLANPES